MTTAAEQDVIELLLTQHNQIKDMFSQLGMATGEQRRDLFEDLVRLLAVHETAEEEVVHPLARRRIESGDQIIDARLHEEQDAKQMLSDMYDKGIDAPTFESDLTALRDAVIAHATHEENEEFPYLRQSVDPDQLRKMATAVRAAEATAPTRPHPSAQTATANVMLGPPLAVFDRMRDAFRGAREPGDG
ncbi:MAG TPA: hemerythrin domain-containing protein [Micromonosporaceae bacterium]